MLERYVSQVRLLLIGLEDAAQLPAVRWKLVNLERLKQVNPGKHAAQRTALERLFR